MISSPGCAKDIEELFRLKWKSHPENTYDFRMAYGKIGINRESE